MQNGYASYGAAKRYARLAGLSYLLLAAGGVFGGFVAIASQVVPGDPMATAANIEGAGRLYRLGVLAWVVTLIFDLIVAWALTIVTAPAAPRLAVLAGLCRTVYVAVHAAVAGNLAAAQRYAEGEGALSAFPPDQLAALANDALLHHKTGFEISLVFFGLHLILIGVLMMRARYLPSWIGVLVAISGLVYLVDAGAWLVLDDYDAYAMPLVAAVSITAIVAELALAFYLVIVGVGRRYAEG